MTSTKKLISQPAEWWQAFEAAAEKEGVTLSAWIGQAGLERLQKKEASKLPSRPPAHRPKLKQPFS